MDEFPSQGALSSLHQIDVSPGSCASMDWTERSSSFCLSFSSADCDSAIAFESVIAKDQGFGEHCGEAALLAVTSLEVDTNATDAPQYLRQDLHKQKRLCHASDTSPDAGCCRVLLPALHRSRLVGWMREVSAALGLHPATTFAAVALLDRYVREAAQSLPPDGLLQLLALACMSVAVKYEEVLKVPPGLWLDLAVDPQGSRLYQAQDLQRMEWSLLQTIGWQLHQPNTLTFLQHYLEAVAGSSPPCHTSNSLQCTGALQEGPGAAHGAATGSKEGGSGSSVGHAFAASEIAAASTGGGAAVRASFTDVSRGPCERVVARSGSSCSRRSSSTAATAQDGGEALRGFSGELLANRAAMFAEVSLMYDAMLPYHYSTIALACVVMAERMFAPPPPPPSGSALAAAAGGVHGATAACFVAAAARMPLGQLAPGLGPCVESLDRCCREAFGWA